MKTELEKSIQYIEVPLNKEKWRYSLSKINSNSNTGYYYCSDTNCQARASNKFYFDDNNLLFNNLKNEKFELIKEHSLKYEEHTYAIKHIIDNDINLLNKNDIKLKLTSHIYLKNFMQYFVEKNSDIGLSIIKLLDKLKNQYGEINIDYSKIKDEEKKKIIENYKKRTGKMQNVNLEDIINLNTIAIGAIHNFKYKNNVKYNFEEQIINLELKNKKIVSKLIINFQRKNIDYIKNAYLIMTDDMITNIKDNNNIQYFSDITY